MDFIEALALADYGDHGPPSEENDSKPEEVDVVESEKPPTPTPTEPDDVTEIISQSKEFIEDMASDDDSCDMSDDDNTEKSGIYTMLQFDNGAGSSSSSPTADLFGKNEAYCNKIRMLLANMDTTQLERYEVFRRSTFKKKDMNRIIKEITGEQPSIPVVIAISGLTKCFVGNLIESALDLKDQETSPEAPLRARHLQHAFHDLKRNNKLPECQSKQKFWRL